ncbi:hypothetical protein BC941DRAFT_411931 [Chlamydoabsidia padenii]|nr:hypothetical protein BC941DRAFT_411931 [Chlamydoabsidia padenii]
MRSLFLLFGLLLLLATTIYADSTYIVALKKGVSPKDIEQAKTDVESAGGKVLHQFKAGNKGFIVTLPDHQFQTMEDKDYVDFVEADHEMHIQN